MNDLSMLELPSGEALIGMLVFSIIGMWAYRSGKHLDRPIRRWTGLALMLYGYFISSTWAVYVVGAGLSAVALFYQE